MIFLLVMLPVFIFFVLGLSMAWLIYQAWQEHAYLEALVNQLTRERELVKQKRNFVTLSSHYLRTPLAIITNSIDLAATKGASPQVASLRSLGQAIAGAVNGLIAIAQTELPQAELPTRPKSINSSVRYLAFSLIGAFIAISLAVYILVYIDKEDVKLSTWLIELALGLLAAVVIFSARRVHNNRKQVKQYFKELIVQHRMLDVQRSGLVASALDQIRSPLGQLKESASTASDPRLISQIMEGVSRFERVLQKFIIYDGLKMGTIGTLRQELQINALLDKIIQRHSQAISAKQLKVKLNTKAGKAIQDALLLEYVLDSLVDNAIAYSPENQTIKIAGKKKGQNYLMNIEDKGPGIEESKLSLLFQPFSSAEDAKKFEHEGMGLSLYLDKLIMIYLGGSISAESKGRGTQINLSFPLNK